MSATASLLSDEKQLFYRVSRGDETAFSLIFYHYTVRIYPFIRKMTRSVEASEDIVQDVFISLWKNRENLQHIDSYQSYIFTMASNKTFNYLKSKAREAKGLKELNFHKENVSDTTLETLNLHESQHLINKLVAALPPQKKLIYKLTREEGLSHEEIATRLNLSKSTVKNHLVEALKILREGLQKSSGGPFLLMSIWIRIHS